MTEEDGVLCRSLAYLGPFHEGSVCCGSITNEKKDRGHVQHFNQRLSVVTCGIFRLSPMRWHIRLWTFLPCLSLRMHIKERPLTALFCMHPYPHQVTRRVAVRSIPVAPHCCFLH